MPNTPHEMTTYTNGPQSPAAIELAEGAKNTWVPTSLGNTVLKVCTYNARTLLGEDRLAELMAQGIGLCETRIKGEHLRILNMDILCTP